MLIGELAARSGISARMLRHYDRIGLVSPTHRTSGGYREYSAEDVQRLFHVEGLRSLGLSLPEVAEVLTDLSFDPAAMVADLIARTRDRLQTEQQLLGRLTAVQASEATAWSEVLGTISLIRGLSADDPSARLRVVLAHSGDSAADAEALATAALDEADPQVAGALYWALARAGDRAVPTLADALGSADIERRKHAVVALAKIGSPAATAALAAAADDPDPFVAARATLARGRLGRPDAIRGLVALVAAGRDDVVASEVLGRLAEEGSLGGEITAAVATALRAADAPARQRLVMALAEIAGSQADTLLSTLAADPDRGVSTAARFAQRTRPPRAGTPTTVH